MSSGLEAGAGALWLLEEETGSVLCIDPASGRMHRVRVDGSPSEVVASGRAVWVAVSEGTWGSRVVRIDPRTAAITSKIEAPGTVEGVAVDDASGDVWAVVPNAKGDPANRDGGQLLRIDPATNEVFGRLSIPGAVSDVVAGGGAVWAIEPGGDLLRIDPARRRISGITPLGSPGPQEIAFGAGAVWIAGVDTLIRVDSTTGNVTGSLKTGPWAPAPDTAARSRVSRRRTAPGQGTRR